jgi:hypothetical protein
VVAAIKTSIGVAFLLLQLGSVICARFTPRRYFCWAPNDYVVEYQLHVKVHGRALSPDEVRTRYQIGPEYFREVEFPAEHLIDKFEQYETTYGLNDGAEVRLTWKYNGHPELRTWQWPR